MSKTVKIIIGVVVVLIIVLIGGKSMGWFGKKGNFKEVTVKEVTLKDIVETVSATGKIQPEVEVVSFSLVNAKSLVTNNLVSQIENPDSGEITFKLPVTLPATDE